MKVRLLSTLGLLFLSMGIIFQACNKDCDCENDNIGKISDYSLKKNIIKTNSSNFATGFETVFQNDYFGNHYPYGDSAVNATYCQLAINTVRFFEDNSGYFFVETYNAWMVAHATKPELIGTYRYDMQDINGKYYVHNMVEAINYKGYGFVDYYFEHPETGVNTKKISFVKAIPAAQFFIGSGFYEYEIEKYHSTEDATLNLVENITTSMAKSLGGVFDSFNSDILNIDYSRAFIDNIRFFDNQSGYFFIYNFDGVNIAHGTQKNLQGENLYDYQDTKGNFVIRDMIEITKNNDSGFYDYYWNNPLNGNEESKKAFVVKIPGYDYFIGSGIYLK